MLVAGLFGLERCAHGLDAAVLNLEGARGR